MTQTTSNIADQALRLSRIREALQRVALIKTDTLRAWMTQQGYDPEHGGELVLPDTPEWHAKTGPFAPGYIRFSKLVASPVLINPRRLGL